MYRILPSKCPWVLELYRPKNGGGRLHGETLHTYNVVNQRIMGKWGWALTRRWVLTWETTRNLTLNRGKCSTSPTLSSTDSKLSCGEMTTPLLATPPPAETTVEEGGVRAVGQSDESKVPVAAFDQSESSDVAKERNRP